VGRIVGIAKPISQSWIAGVIGVGAALQQHETIFTSLELRTAIVQRTVFSAIRGNYADSTSTRTDMDMAILLDARDQTRVPVVIEIEEDGRSRPLLWPALVIAFATCVTLLWVEHLVVVAVTDVAFPLSVIGA
jgi:hypothetical protein